MGIEYRIETYDFARAGVAQKLRDRHFVVRETSGGLSLWETEPAEGMPDVELQTVDNQVTMVLSGGSPEFRERVVGAVLMSIATVNDHVVVSEQ
jgi:hypothetical protein